MIDASNQLLRTLQESHVTANKATIVQGGKNEIYTMNIVDGNVRIDATAKQRRTADVKLTDPTGQLVPSVLTDLLHPLSGNEVWLYRGAFVPEFNGTELCMLGAFTIKDAEVTDSGEDLAITLKLFDRSLGVERSRVTEPYVVTTGQHLGTVIRDVITLRYPKVVFGNDFTLVLPWVTAPAGVIDRSTDIWALMVKWAQDSALDLHFDNEGRLMLVPLPGDNPSVSEVVWSFDEGALSTLLSVRKNITSDDTYNHVVCYSQPTDGITPVSGEAKITDVRHPLAITGPMGDIPFFYSSNMFTSTAQCEMVANALLYKHLGHTEHVHFNALVNPCLTDGDLVSVYRAKSKVYDYYTLDKLTIPLVGQRAMECNVRERFILDV